MDATTAQPALSSKPALDIASIVIVTAAWGTTFFAITLQLGVVDPLVSVVYRFALAAVLLFVWCKVSGQKIGLTRPQHLAALGVGLFTFAISYPVVYIAEQHVTSAAVALVYAATAFVNLALFRVVYGQRAPVTAWIGALLGVSGVGLISWDEISTAPLGGPAFLGLGLAFTAMIIACVGNVAARRGEQLGAPVPSLTAWSMGYGAALLAVFSLLTGHAWTFDSSPAYIGSLFYLAIVGSVVAFLLYFGLARRRGYGTAAYVSAMAPLLAMFVSSVMEHKTWGLVAFFAVALVLTGQVLLLRGRKA